MAGKGILKWVNVKVDESESESEWKWLKVKVGASGLEDDDKSRIDKLLAGWGENDVWKCGRDLENILYEKER